MPGWSWCCFPLRIPWLLGEVEQKRYLRPHTKQNKKREHSGFEISEPELCVCMDACVRVCMCMRACSFLWAHVVHACGDERTGSGILRAHSPSSLFPEIAFLFGLQFARPAWLAGQGAPGFYLLLPALPSTGITSIPTWNLCRECLQFELWSWCSYSSILYQLSYFLSAGTEAAACRQRICAHLPREESGRKVREE